MRLIDIATERRVTIGMAMIAIVIFGLVALSRLSVTLLPDLSYPTLTIRTDLSGTAPEEIETLITKPIEESSGVIKNLKRVRSVSKAGQSDVTLEFNWGTNMDLASVDVREKIDLLNLPEEAGKPLLLRFDPGSEPIIRYALVASSGATPESDDPSGASLESSIETLKRLRRFADERLKTDLEAIDGAASVKISGGFEDEILITVDQENLSQKGLSIQSIADRLQQENINMSGGQIEEDQRRLQVRTVNQFESLDDIKNTIIAINDSRPTYLYEVAKVEMLYKQRKAIFRVNGNEAIELAIYKEGDANTVQVAKRIRNAVESYAAQKQASDPDKEKSDAEDPDGKPSGQQSRNNRGDGQGFMASRKQPLPAGSDLKLVQDQSVFIADAISQVRSAAVLGGLLAIFVLYGFLRDARSTWIIGLTIPVSVIGTFFLMYQMDLSLNIMSLGGIALAIGLLVDNSIVVLENIAQKREKGLDQVQAAKEGTTQVAMAVTASTFTTVAVFFPMVFVSGIAGQLFKDQALTVSFALIFSLIVALTLIPMLSTLGTTRRFEQDAEHELAQGFKPDDYGSIKKGFSYIGRLFLVWIPVLITKIIQTVFKLVSTLLHYVLKPFVWVFNRLYTLIARLYAPFLTWSLGNRSLIVATSIMAFAASLSLVPRLGTELIPQLAQGEFYADIRLQPGTPISSTDSVLRQAQENMRNDDRIKLLASVAGTGNRLDAAPVDSGDNAGRLNVQINKAGQQGNRIENGLRNDLREQLSGLPGVAYEFGTPELVSFSTPLQVVIGGYDLDQLQAASQQVIQLMQNTGLFSDIRSTIEQGQPEIHIIADTQKATALGLNERDIANSVVNKVRGKIATKYSWRDRKIDVLIRSLDATDTSREEINKLIINPQSDRPVPLSSVASIEESLGPSSINRIDQRRVALISANVLDGDLGSAVDILDNELKQSSFPTGINAEIKGQSEEMQEAFKSLQFAMLFAIFLVYLVMASQFESLVHPFVILFTIPLALIGSILALYVTGTTINVVALIGLIMLAGIVVNNGIVLIDLINQLRAAGLAKTQAILEGSRDRLRPILMTAMTTILGLLPMAIGVGEGAEIRAPMAITVIGGMLVATLLTLIVIPVVYSLLDNKRYQSV
ncbi:MAG: efflux RND transporter permease subunit [Gammaproteobacteria bacterium]|nr:efflux RND transporter permease subunit [Gammaproteobacteria bacterium]NNC98395.1 efflux RND transporter permease subunit [Gammaproteobacteria bacterium]NNM13063.1 efflux RND transporter permease subunit [Gammaproteobacteria bacterium]